MNRLLKKSATHAACVAIGLGLAAWIGGRMKDGTIIRRGTENGSSSQAREFSSVENGGRGGSGKRTSAVWKSADFRKAWDAIASRPFTARERCDAQMELLRRWSMIDLEAAMAAALSSNWKGGYDEGGVNSLIPVFADAFAKDPIGAWALIQSGKLGIGGALFRWQWVTSVMDGNPLLVVSYFNELSPSLRRGALASLLRKYGNDPAVTEAITTALGNLPLDADTATLATDLFQTAPPSGTPAEIGSKIASASSDQQRMLAIREFASLMRTTDVATLMAELGKLPPGIRGEAVRALVTAPGASKNATQLVDHAIRTGDWEFLKDPRVSGHDGLLAMHAQATKDPIALAEWGLALPDRPETQDLFRRAVSAYIGANHADAREWILTIPQNDWRRDRALAEYSQNSLWYQKDPAGSQWAIDRIGDPAIKDTVINWRQEWEQRNGR